MSKFVNFKKITVKVLIGIVLAGSLVTVAGTKQAVAGTCRDGNSGHGGDELFTVLSLSDGAEHIITVSNFDPDNPGKGNVRNNLKTALMNGDSNAGGQRNIRYSNGSIQLTDAQAEYVIDNLSGETRGSLSPATFTDTIDKGETVSLDRTVTINCIPNVVTTTTGTAVTKLDVLFLADNTNSMTDAITNIQTNAASLLDSLSNEYSDVQFGVARYYGDPRESTGETETVCTKYKKGECTRSETRDLTFGATGAYQLQEAVNGGTEDETVAAINQWQSSDPNTDWEEGNFFALHQAATNGATVNSYGTGSNTGWRPDAEKVIVWFGDAFSHENTINKASTIQALKNNGIKVVAINADTKTYKYLGYYLSSVRGLDYNSQASNIATQTGGAFASADPTQLYTTIINLVGDALTSTENVTATPGTIDLVFEAQGNTSGLNVTYTCTDPLGCTNVAENQSRTLRMDVQGVTPGTYDFETVVIGVDGAVGDDEVTVVDVFAD